MQSNTTIDYIIFISLLHVPIHIRINQTENNRLISYQCLVMAFCIRNSFFILATVSDFPEHAGRFPVLIYLFFDCLDPVIRNIHSHAVVESVTTIFYFCSQSRHTGHLLSNRYRFWIHLMNHFISQGQITDSIIILMSVEVISVITERFTQSVTIIQHRRYTVKTESIEFIFFQPVFTVRQQEVNDFILAIVKTKRIPRRMFTTPSRIEILVRITGKITQSFYLILHCMGMNNIHNNSDTHSMSSIDQLLQLIRSTETGRSGKETGYVVTETSIIRMFLNSHYLNTIIPFFGNAGKHLFTEFII